MKKLIRFLELKAIAWESLVLNSLVTKLTRFDRWLEDKYFEWEQQMYGIQSDAYLLEEMRKRTANTKPSGMTLELGLETRKNIVVEERYRDQNISSFKVDYVDKQQAATETPQRDVVKAFIAEVAENTPRPKSQKAPKKKVAKKKTLTKKKPRRSNNK